MALLLLADESETQVRATMQRGELYAFSTGARPDRTAGIVLTAPREPGVVELKAVAVEPRWQRQGIGLRMVRAVLDDLRARGAQRAIVGTGNAGIGQLAFYQKAGFRLLRVERDFFTPARGYAAWIEQGGIRLLDMVWMDCSLRGSAT
jgi:ribosomal protein S18 acetylase RimI-like enzyme